MLAILSWAGGGSWAPLPSVCESPSLPQWLTICSIDAMLHTSFQKRPTAPPPLSLPPITLIQLCNWLVVNCNSAPQKRPMP